MGKVKKIMLAEKDGRLMDEGGGLLDRGGFLIFRAESAEEALALHGAEEMDLIVADIDLPRMGGDKLCAAIKQDPELKPVYISLVCSGRKADLLRCARCGADSFMKRPTELREVTEKICRILDIIERRDKRVLLKCQVHGTYQDEPFFSTSRDLSVSGILFETDRALARGDRVSFSFILPDASRVEAVGRVVRVLPGEEGPIKCGVEFEEMSPGSREVIERFIQASEELTAEEIY